MHTKKELEEELKETQKELEELCISCFELKLGNSEKQKTIRKLICIVKEDEIMSEDEVSPIAIQKKGSNSNSDENQIGKFFNPLD